MNITFWLLVATMILIALLFVVLPLLKKRDGQLIEESSQRNIQIARERLAELKANQASGGISQEQYDEQVAELELALSDDLDTAENSTKITKEPHQGRWLVRVLMVAIPLFSLALYGKLGNYEAIEKVNDPSQRIQAEQPPSGMPTPEQINQMVTKLANKLKAEPNNLQGWLMLGRSYKTLQRYPEAIAAFEHAYQLSGNKPEILLPYAETLALAKKGDWGGKPIELINLALSAEPNNLPALWFAAIAKAQQGDNKAAVSYLRKLENLLPEGSSDKQQIQTLIANTEQEITKNNQATPVQTEKTAKVSVEIDVSIAPEMKAKVDKEDTVFIYAQAASGPKMPLAIVKKQVQDLPIKVSLSDADSMMPQMKLSDFQQVRLVARISKSGSAMPQTGDFIGEIAQANFADKSFKIIINQSLK